MSAAAVILRVVFVILCGLASLAAGPVSPAIFGDRFAPSVVNFAAGLLAGGFGLLLEWRLRTLPLRIIVGGMAGMLVGAATGRVMMAALPHSVREAAPIQPLLYLVLALSGMMIGAYKGSVFQADHVMALFRPGRGQRVFKILDTSVIIDGRIEDICETGFVEGTLLVPQFVLRELQLVADSADTLKRNRGRKGLDILQRMKKNTDLDVVFSDMDFPEIREVDQKLIELARHVGGKIVTNDFNLNKVARLRGVPVLNINELANSLKPVVLPGETMTVFILKEGKEPNQGVAYLDDGTMVVVDNARRQIGQNVEIMVTSVLQTTAGKMFFGRATGDARRDARERDADEG